MKIAIMKNKELTKFAKLVFGDIIDTVYNYADNYDEDEVNDFLERELGCVETIKNKEGCQMVFDTCDILFKFKNGKEVFMTLEGSVNLFSRINVELLEVKL